MNTPQLVDLTEALKALTLTGEALVRLLLLDEDLRSVQLSFSDYRATEQAFAAVIASGRGFGTDELHDLRSRLFHYAKTYVCGMRRYARTLEALSGARALYPPPVAKAIRLAWRKKKTALGVFTAPRDAIEHLDDRIRGRQRWALLNLHGASLAVTDAAAERAPLRDQDVVGAAAAPDEIVAAILGTAGTPVAG